MSVEYQRKYRLEHRVELNANRRVYYQSHRLECGEACRRCNEAHRSERLAYKREYYRKHKAEYIEGVRVRRAKSRAELYGEKG